MAQLAPLQAPIRVEREIGGRTLVIETGSVGKLANATVMATYGGTTVLAAVVRSNPRGGIDFFPLTVDYREKTSAAGKFPGGFRKREGAPNEKEILTMRMIDRPMRPLFPDGFLDEVQVQVFVLSHDGENDSDVLAGTAASAALALSDIPFEGPTATVRVGRIHTDDGPRYVINPTVSQMDFSDMDVVVAGHKDGLNMIEVGAAEVDEKGVLGALDFGYTFIRDILELIGKLQSQVGKAKVMGELHLPTPEISAKIAQLADGPLTQARQIKKKHERGAAVDKLRKEVLDTHFPLKAEGNYAEYGVGEGPLHGEGGVQAAGGEDHPPPDREGPDPRRRAWADGDPPHHGRGRHLPADARLGPLPARRDAEPRQRDARHREG
jgi:polyribonucleotide nucleotidyltransferase